MRILMIIIILKKKQISNKRNVARKFVAVSFHCYAKLFCEICKEWLEKIKSAKYIFFLINHIFFTLKKNKQNLSTIHFRSNRKEIIFCLFIISYLFFFLEFPQLSFS